MSSGGARSVAAAGRRLASRGHHVGGAVQGVHAARAQAAPQVQAHGARGRAGTCCVTVVLEVGAVECFLNGGMSEI